MPENKLLDSNILVYAFDRSEPAKHKIASVLLNRCLDREETFFLSLQNISEFYNVITRHIEKPVSKEEARRICEKMIGFSGLVKLVPTSVTLVEAMRLNERYNIPYWDAMLVAIMQENGVGIIYTENVKDFQKMPGITIINPF